jgi:hypothetical protein
VTACGRKRSCLVYSDPDAVSRRPTLVSDVLRSGDGSEVDEMVKIDFSLISGVEAKNAFVATTGRSRFAGIEVCKLPGCSMD